jgi:hypothetical protein
MKIPSVGGYQRGVSRAYVKFLFSILSSQFPVVSRFELAVPMCRIRRKHKNEYFQSGDNQNLSCKSRM